MSARFYSLSGIGSQKGSVIGLELSDSVLMRATCPLGNFLRVDKPAKTAKVAKYFLKKGVGERLCQLVFNNSVI